MKIYISCSCYLCFISAFEVGTHVCSSLHHKLVTVSLASTVVEETMRQNCLSWARCRYCSLITPHQPIKNSVDTLSKNTDKTQHEHEKSDPNSEQWLNNVFWDISQRKEQNHCLDDPTDPREDMLTDSRRMLSDSVWYKEITGNNNKT